MINLHNLTVSFGGEDLFSKISFRLEKGDRVGLVGKNGAGKSTLLKVIAGAINPDGGSFALEKDVNIGFLRQDIDFVSGRTILEEAYQAFEEIVRLEAKLAKINEALAVRTDYESEAYTSLLNDLDAVSRRYELMGGYNYQGDTEKILQGLGFQRTDFDKSTETFSGGWRMRIELAKLLLQANDVLLLDEPTNHLDIESIVWLEDFLKSYSGAVVLVSHDKMFLDNVTNRTLEISLGHLYDCKKPYSQYLVFRQEIREKQLQSQKNQDREIKAKQQLIEKFRAKANKASMAQSLIKQLDKIERIEVDAEDTAVMHVKFPVSKRPGKVVIETESLSKSYGSKTVLQDVNLSIERGAKIAFVGQNGQGKSTLAKMMVREIDHEGVIKWGHNVEIGYFAQNQAVHLDGEKTVLETMEAAANDSNRMRVRDMLGAFLFGGDAVEKKVKVLSGGERNRLAICKMLLTPFNLLIMDEPTNHLDIKSKQVLKNALQQYEGTLILVSHDRDFLQGLTEKVFGFKDRIIKEYLGDIDCFLEAHKLENLREAAKKTQQKTTSRSKKSRSEGSWQRDKALKKLKNKSSKLEAQISVLEKEILEMDAALSEAHDLVADAQFFEKYQAKKDALEELVEHWTLLEEEISTFS